MTNEDDIWADFRERKKAKGGDADVDRLLDMMEGSLIAQESGGRQKVRNPRTNATGLFQVMPSNIPVWTKQYLGRSLTPEQFAGNADAQRSVFRGEMGKYLRKARQRTQNDDEAIRMASAAWYGGEGAMGRYNDGTRFRPDEPSFREYTTSILNHIKKGGRNAYSGGIEDIWADFQPNRANGQAQPVATPVNSSNDAADIWADFRPDEGDLPGIPSPTTTTTGANTQFVREPELPAMPQAAEPAPMPDAKSQLDALRAQFEEDLAAATLAGDTAKIAEIQDAIAKLGISQGETAAEDRARALLTPRDAAMPQIETLGGVIEEPLEQQPARQDFVPPPPPAVLPKTPPAQQQATSADYQNWLKDTGQTDSNETRTDWNENVLPALAKIEQETAAVNQPDIDAYNQSVDKYNKDIAAYNAKYGQQQQPQQEQDVGGSRQPRVLGKTSSGDMNTVMSEFQPPKSVKDAETAVRAALKDTGRFTPAEINKWVSAHKRHGIALLSGNYKPGATIQVPWYVYEEIKGEKAAETDKRLEEGKNYTSPEISNADPLIKPEHEAEKEIDKRIRERDYSLQQTLKESILGASGIVGYWMSSDEEREQMGISFNNLMSGNPRVSEKWAEIEKKRLLKEHGSYSKAWRNEQYYQGMPATETLLRMGAETSRSFVKSLVTGTAKTALLLDNLNETTWQAFVPDKNKVSLRNLGNGLDMIVRLMQGDSLEQAARDYRGSDDLLNTHFFRSIQAAEKTLGEDPILKERFLGSLSSGAGSMLSFVAMGGLMPAVNIGRVPMGMGIAGSMTMAGAGYEEGRESGLSETAAKGYGVWTGLLGLTEALGAGQKLVSAITSPTVKKNLVHGILEAATKGALKEAPEEFGQEVFQTVGGKAALEFLKESDKGLYERTINALNRLPEQIAGAVAEEGLVALILGGVMGGAGGSVQGVKDRRVSKENVADAKEMLEAMKDSIDEQTYEDAKTALGEIETEKAPKKDETTQKTNVPAQPAQVAAESLVQAEQAQGDAPAGVTGVRRTPLDQRIVPTLEQDAEGMDAMAPLRPETLEGAQSRIKEVEAERDTERRRADAATIEANTNPLTGLGSKIAWQKAKPNIEADAGKAIISLDANNVKTANDVSSHDTVDKKVIARLGEVTKKVFEKHGLPIRDAFTPSGDELFVGVPVDQAEAIRDEIEKEFGTVDIVAERDYTNTRTGETFKKGDIVPVTLSGAFGQTVKDAEKGLGERKAARKAAVKRATPEGATHPYQHSTEATRAIETIGKQKRVTNPADDPNIGRTWHGQYGYSVIIARDDWGSGASYVTINDKGEIRKYSSAGIDKKIEEDVRSITPEGKKRAADALAKFKAAQARKAEDAKQKEEQNAAAKEARGFTDGLTPMQTGRIAKVLQKRWDFGNGVKSTQQYIEDLADANDLQLTTEQENRIKEKSRIQRNRMNYEQQRDHERRIAEGGQITKYYINGYNLGKIAYDYAQYLQQGAKGKAIESTTTRPSVKDILTKTLGFKYKEFQNDADVNRLTELYLEGKPANINILREYAKKHNMPVARANALIKAAKLELAARRESEASTDQPRKAATQTNEKTGQDKKPYEMSAEEAKRSYQKSVEDDLAKQTPTVKARTALQDANDKARYDDIVADDTPLSKLSPKKIAELSQAELDELNREQVEATRQKRLTAIKADLTSGELTPERAFELGLYESYPELALESKEVPKATPKAPPSFAEKARELWGEHWYVSNRSIKRYEEAGARRVKRSEYTKAENEWNASPEGRRWADWEGAKAETRQETPESKVESESATTVAKTPSDVQALPASEQVSVTADPSAKKAKDSVKTEKVSDRTGLTRTQTEYLAQKLQDVVHTAVRKFHNFKTNKEFFAYWDNKFTPHHAEQIKLEMPDFIKVPGDGSFRLYSADSANRLHHKITGKPIPGFAKTKDVSIPRTKAEVVRAEMRPPNLGKPSKIVRDKIAAEQARFDDALTIDPDVAATYFASEDYETYAQDKETIDRWTQQAKEATDRELQDLYTNKDMGFTQRSIAQAEFIRRLKGGEGSLRQVADIADITDSLYTKSGDINYDQVKDVAGRVERGELEIVRLDRQGEQGRIEGGRRNVEASLILAADERAVQAASAKVRSRLDSHADTVKRQEKLIENYAKRNDIWFKPGHFPEHLYLGKGGEANVYRKDATRVAKTVDYRHIDKSLTLQKFLDNRISLFNHIFPEAPYELMGFMRDSDGKFRVIVTQPIVKGLEIYQQADVDTFMSARGLERSGYDAYSNALYQAHDLHMGNVLRDADGNIFVIDAVPKPTYELQPFEIVVPDAPLKSALPTMWDSNNYHRVMPRDLFNEAKTLSMHLKFIDDYNSGKLPAGFSIDINEQDPKVALSEDGSLYLPNVDVYFDGEPVEITVGYNAGKDNKFPLEVTQASNDVWSVPVYTEDGSLDEEFIEGFGSDFAKPNRLITPPEAWQKATDFYKQLGIVGLWEADRLLPDGFVFQLAEPEAGFQLNLDGDTISSANLESEYNGKPVVFTMDTDEGILRFESGNNSGPVLSGREMSAEFRELIGNRGTFDPNEDSILKSALATTNTSDLGFYSQVEKTIIDKMPNKASAQQIKGILSPNNGVKAAELEWLDLDSFLADNPKPTKEQIVDYIRANNVQVEEVVKGEGKFAAGWSIESPTLQTWFDQESRAFHELRQEADDDGEQIWVHYEDSGDGDGFQRHDWEYDIDSLKANIDVSESGFGSDRPDDTKFSQFTLPGGENYRELLLTMPERESAPQFFVTFGNGLTTKPTSRETAEKVLASLQGAFPNATIKEQSKAQNNAYKSSHFDEPNILAHVRFDERDGGKTLHISEMQSDALQLLRKLQAKLDRGEVLTTSERSDYDILSKWPFKKTWHEFAFKRMLRYAAENGYEKITWDTGETQADRYDLSKQVDSVVVGKNGDSYWFRATPIGERGTGENQIERDGLTANELSGAIGKELAERAVNEIGDKDGQRAYHDSDLKVGGEGMRGFYDKMLPSFVNKYTKKWGGKVEGGELVTDRTFPFENARIVENEDPGDGTNPFVVFAENTQKENREEFRGSFPTREAANEYIATLKGKPTPVHSLQITAAMRDAALAGQAMFQVATPERQAYLQDLRRAHPQDLLERADAVMAGEHLELNEEAGEITRRLMMDTFKGDAGRSFTGVLHTASSLRKLADAAIKAADRYVNKLGYTKKQAAVLRTLAAQFNDLAEKGKHGIAYVFEDALPEETHHKLVLDGGGISNKAVKQLKKSPLWKSRRFDNEYPAISDRNRAIEIAAKLETGQEAKYWPNKQIAAAKRSFLRTFAEDFIANNTIDGKLQLDPIKYERIIKYAEDGNTAGNESGAGTEQTGQRTPRSNERGRSESDREPDTQDGERTRDRDRRDQAGGDGNGVGTPVSLEPDGNKKLSQTPISAREKAGIPIEDRTYTAVTDASRVEYANTLLDKGVDDAVRWFNEQVADKQLHGGTTAVVGINLLNTLGKDGRINEMNEVADKLVPMVTSAAQTVQAMHLLSMFDPERAGAYAAKVAKQKAGKDLTKEQFDKAVKIAAEMQQAATEGAVTKEAFDKAQADLEKLTKDIASLESINTKISIDLDEALKTIRRLTRVPVTRKTAKVRELIAREDDILAAIAETYGIDPDVALKMVAWHGSPHVFDKFSTDNIGTGEGNQAYGYGLYFADQESVADHYRKTLTKFAPTYKGKRILDAYDGKPKADAIYRVAQAMLSGKKNPIKWALHEIETDIREMQVFGDKWKGVIADKKRIAIEIEHLNPDDFGAVDGGAKYRVDLKPAEDEYLLWDKPLSEQSDTVKKALEKTPVTVSQVSEGKHWTISRFSAKLDIYNRDGKYEVHGINKLGTFDTLPDAKSDATRLLSTVKVGENGNNIYQNLKRQFQSEKAASEYLLSLGIRGIKYLDGSSRSRGEGSYNYVIFADEDVEVQEVLKQVAPDNDTDIDIDPNLVDWATIYLSRNINKITPETFFAKLNALTANALTPEQLGTIHAEAVANLRRENPRTMAQKTAAQIRQAHIREAKKYQQAEVRRKATTKRDKLADRIIAHGTTPDSDVSPEVMMFALIREAQPDVERAIKVFKGKFPDISQSDLRKVMTDADSLIKAVKQDIKDEIVERKNGAKLAQDDIRLLDQHLKDKQKALRRLERDAARFYSSLAMTPVEIALEGLVNWRRASLLTGPKTHLRNIVSTGLHTAFEEVIRLPATAVDIAASKFTGRRSITGASPAAIYKSFNAIFKPDETLKAAGRDSGLTTAKNILMHGATFEEMERQQHVQSLVGEMLAEKTGIKAFEWIDTYIDTTFNSLSAEDALFKVYAFRRSLEDQAKVLGDTNLLKTPTAEMIALADEYAQFVTFTNPNQISDWLTSAKKANKYGKAAIEIIVPYDRTPTNIVLRAIDMTPAGFIRSAKAAKRIRHTMRTGEVSQSFRNKFAAPITRDMERTVKDWNELTPAEQAKQVENALKAAGIRYDQRIVSRSAGAATVGSAIFTMGYLLAASGLLTGIWAPDDDDREETKEFFERRKIGLENRSLKIGNYRFVLPDDPAMRVLTAGATMFEQSQRFRGDSTMSMLTGAGDAIATIAFDDQPLLRGVGDTYQNIKKGRYGQMVGNIAGGYVPTIAAEIGEVIDDKPRTASGYKKGENRKQFDENLAYQMRGLRNSFFRRVPIVRQYMADEATGTVSAEERGGPARRAVRQLIDIFNTRTAVKRPGQKERGFIETLTNYAEAIGTDPITAFDHIFAGEVIRKTENGTVIVDRMPLDASRKESAKQKASGKVDGGEPMRLDHTVPLQLGGTNDPSNLKLVPKSQWQKYTPIENLLGRELRKGNIDKDTALELMREFKAGNISASTVRKRVREKR